MDSVDFILESMWIVLNSYTFRTEIMEFDMENELMIAIERYNSEFPQLRIKQKA